MRNDIYAVYNNFEYRLGARDGDWINLCSPNSNDLNNGFTLYKEVVYVKKVRIKQLDAIYSIKTFADYKGYRCQVLKETDGKLLLHAMIGDYKICESLGFDMVDRYVSNYEKLGRIYLNQGNIADGKKLIKTALNNIELVYDENSTSDFTDINEYLAEYVTGIHVISLNKERLEKLYNNL